MRVLLVERPLSGATSEEIAQASNPMLLCEPVALVCVAHDISDEEMNAIGRNMLEAIGDKPVNTDQVMAVYSILMDLS